MASGDINSDQNQLIDIGSSDNYGTESASRQGNVDTFSFIRNDRTETSFHGPGSNGETTPESAGTGNRPSNADTSIYIQSDGGQSGQIYCEDKLPVLFWVFVLSLVHAVKLGVVTYEIYLIGTDRATFSGIIYGGHLTLRHVLLENWDASWETPPYPPSHGDFAVYTIDDVESGINYAVSRYYNAEKHVAGLYKRMDNDSMEAIIKYFDLPDSEDDSHGITITERHFPIEHGLTKNQTNNATIYSYSIADELEYLNLSHAMERLLSTKLKFTIYSFRRSLEETKPTFCICIDGDVTFKDTDINGKVLVNLKTHTSKINCRDMGLSVEDSDLVQKTFGTSRRNKVFLDDIRNVHSSWTSSRGS